MTVGYFDTSALVPLMVAETATDRCTRAWDAVDLVVTTSLACVETRAALAMAMRMGRLTCEEHATALRAFAARWQDAVIVHPADELLHHAGRLALDHRLRGYDAVHCATAVAVASADFVAVSGDRDLLRAWGDLGIHTSDTTM